jgi:RNA polymerase sigma-70 factor (family 1)
MDNILYNIKAGDLSNFKMAYQRYHEKLYFYVIKHTQSDYLAEETVQMTFIKLWENRSGLAADIDLSQQIFRIAKSTMIDLLRKEGRRQDHIAALAGQTAAFTAEEPDLSKKEDLRQIYDAIEQMAPVRKTVFKLSRLDGRTHKEIAEQLSISPKTVENHIGRAIRQLKDTLALFFL